MLYQQLLETTVLPSGQVDAQQVVSLLAEQINANNAYTQYGQLLAAKVAVDTNRLDDAAVELNAILQKPANPTLQELARQRLARVLLAQEKAQQALQLLEAEVQPAFAATREELSGDALVVLERPAEARQAYLQAQQALPSDATVGDLLMKLDNLSEKDA